MLCVLQRYFRGNREFYGNVTRVSAHTHTHKRKQTKNSVAGPGNNGGDALVSARHLHHFGYKPSILYPKRSNKRLFENLVSQCKALNIPFQKKDEVSETSLNKDYDVILDGIFGFSFKGDSIRSPFDRIMDSIRKCDVPIVSIDVPSGWHVESGDIHNIGLTPKVLISLTAPKMCATKFKGKYHFLGGRFVPPAIMKKYTLELPDYPGVEQVVELRSSSISTV